MSNGSDAVFTCSPRKLTETSAGHVVQGFSGGRLCTTARRVHENKSRNDVDGRIVFFFYLTPGVSNIGDGSETIMNRGQQGEEEEGKATR